jgi:prepilin peptidase CpaA
MIIPNRINIALFLVFVILGIFIFPLPEYGIRLVQAAVMLFIGIFLTVAGVMGGGDSKLLAASAPFIALQHIPTFIFALALMSLAAVCAHRILGRIPLFKQHVADWTSWGTRSNFPFGVPIAVTVSLYLFSIGFFV